MSFRSSIVGPRGTRAHGNAYGQFDRRFLPEYHFVERHRRTIRAAPPEVLAATKAVRSWDARLVAALFFIRGLPARILGRHAYEGATPDGKPMLDFFVPLAESPEEFLTYADPTFAKSVINLRVAPVDGGTLLTTETRVMVPDPVARAGFSRYWLVVMPGSALIRRGLLAAVARRVERLPQG